MAAKTKKMTKKPAKAAAAPKPAKLAASSKVRSKGEVFRTIAEQTGVGKKDVAAVFDTMTRMIAADLGKGAGVFAVPGLMKVTVVRKPAQPARKNVPNPFKPGETMDVAAKPARNVVKVRALKALKAMV
jgi:nucleoid DNA-binding protein